MPAARSLLAAFIQIPFADCRGVRQPNFLFFEGEFLRGVLAFWVAEFGGQDRLAPAFWDIMGHAAIWPTQNLAASRSALSSRRIRYDGISAS
jgi:hypothetical protein